MISPSLNNIQIICQTVHGEGVNIDTLARAIPRYMDRQGVTHNPLPSALPRIRWRVWSLIHA